MGHNCSQYKPEQISRYVDGELSPDEQARLSRHMAVCPVCSRTARQYQAVATAFAGFAEKTVSLMDKEKLARSRSRTQEKDKVSWSGQAFGLFGRNIYLKLASIAAIVVISLVTFQSDLFGPGGPSAIVTSVDTDVSSVMIIETHKEQHTIIWFSET